MKIPKYNRRIIIAGGLVFLVVLIFLFLIYLPKWKELVRLKEELSIVESKIEKTGVSEGGMEWLEVAILRLNEELKKFEKKLPDKEESTLREISNTASQMGIEVLSITPSKSKTSSLSGDIRGCELRELKISMQLKAPFRVFGEYLRVLENRFPTAIRINNFILKKDGRENSPMRLSISLEITMYMLCPV